MKVVREKVTGTCARFVSEQPKFLIEEFLRPRGRSAQIASVDRGNLPETSAGSAQLNLIQSHDLISAARIMSESEGVSGAG